LSIGGVCHSVRRLPTQQNGVGEEPTSIDGLLEIINGTFLRVEAVALVVMEPAQLLENLCMLGRYFKDLVVGSLGIVELQA
jgi:hypothetical protein